MATRHLHFRSRLILFCDGEQAISYCSQTLTDRLEIALQNVLLIVYKETWIFANCRFFYITVLIFLLFHIFLFRHNFSTKNL